MDISEYYKKTEVGLIPSDWNVCEIQDAYEICNNLRYPISEATRKYMQGKYPYYGPTKIQDYINEYRLDGEYALIGEDGDHFLKWNTMSMTLLATGKFNVNNHAHVLKGVKNETKWFYWYFNHRDITPYLTRQGAGRYKLNKATLKTIKMPIPMIPEQQAISEALSDVDNLITSLEKLLDKKRKIKQGAMQNLLTGKRRLPGFTSKRENKMLIEIIDIKKGHQINKDTLFASGEHPVINGGIEPSGYAPVWNNHENTITISEGGNSCGYVNLIKRKFWSGGHCYTIHLKSKEFDNSYIYYILKYSEPKIMALRLGSGLPNIQRKSIEKFKLSITLDLQEQRSISQILSDIDAEIGALEQKLDKYKTIKQGMMQQLLTGRIRLV